jgi:hypothetical protein
MDGGTRGGRRMRFLHWRVVLGLFWLVTAVGLFLREELLPPDLLANYRGRNLAFGAWLALLLAGWNLARWYQAESMRRRVTSDRKPLRPQPGAAGGEYNPEFDFQKMERGDSGERPA